VSTNVILVRHGETSWNAQERIQGQHDVPLSMDGVQQARCLQARFQSLHVSYAYSSDLKRSLETARIALEGTELPIPTRIQLRERGFGEWEGKLWTEIVQQFPKEAADFLKDPVGFNPPGGEPWIDMQNRAFEEVTRIAQSHPGCSVAVFTHGGPAKAIVLKALDIRPSLWRQLKTHNASLNTLELTSKGWRLVCFNDTCHLNNLSRQTSPVNQETGQAKREPIG